VIDRQDWKQLKNIAKWEERFAHMGNQVKLRSYKTAPGFEAPRTCEKALDKRNEITLWGDATQIDELKSGIRNT
jgi:hypothetical protein